MRSESKLVCLHLSNELAKYTLEITSNQRVFSPRFDAFTRHIVDNAFGIGQSIWMANDINVRSAEDYSKRHGLQRDALLECDALLYNITLAKNTFHLSRKGLRDKAMVDECYRCYRDHISKGNSMRLLERMDAYYKSLWR